MWQTGIRSENDIGTPQTLVEYLLSIRMFEYFDYLSIRLQPFTAQQQNAVSRRSHIATAGCRRASGAGGLVDIVS